jgi:hypothetical protein
MNLHMEYHTQTGKFHKRRLFLSRETELRGRGHTNKTWRGPPLSAPLDGTVRFVVIFFDARGQHILTFSQRQQMRMFWWKDKVLDEPEPI